MAQVGKEWVVSCLLWEGSIPFHVVRTDWAVSWQWWERSGFYGCGGNGLSHVCGRKRVGCFMTVVGWNGLFHGCGSNRVGCLIAVVGMEWAVL